MKKKWEIARLGKLCSISSGESDTQDATADGKYAFFDRSKTVKRSSRFLYDCETLIVPGEGREFLPRHFKGKFDLHQRAYALFDFSPTLDVRFLYHFLHHRADYFPGVAVGATVKSLRRRHFENLDVPVPPLSEQRRIVDLLDAAFQGTAIAKANTEKNRQSVGVLFENHVRSVFGQSGAKWVKKPLGVVADVQSGGTPSVPQKAFWNGNIPWYSSGELNEVYTRESERKISVLGLDNSNAKLFPKGSLLIGMYDTAALKMSILDRDGAFNQAIAGLRPNERVEAEFVLHAINAIKPRLLLERRGVRQKNLSLGKIKEIQIPLPGVVEQRAVVSALQKVKSETGRLAIICERKLAALDSLKKSLLHQAFSGAL